MRKSLFLLFVNVVIVAVLAACGGSSGNGDPAVEAGKELFAATVIGNQAGCSACHSLEAGVSIVGPSIAGIGSRSDQAYIRQAILDPDAVIAEGFSPGMMPDVWGDALSGEQVDQLVAYLLTLK